MIKQNITLDELIQTVKRSDLPTVITEGLEDYRIFRWMEERLKNLSISLLPAGGRDMVLKLFENRKKFERNDVFFIADRDLWIFTGVPEAYCHRKLSFTDGYSIENDLYRDGNLEILLHEKEKVLFENELISIVEWYLFAVRRILDGHDATLSEHPNQVLGPNGGLCSTHCQKIGYSSRDEAIF